LVYGTGRSAYRILFVVFDDDAEVRIIRFRHGARQLPQQTQEED
jgi:plasmid stabilization system protein ParE